MSRIQIENFKGIAPRFDPRRLPENHAQTAHNCRLSAGVIEPLREPTSVEASPGTNFFYKWRYSTTSFKWIGFDYDTYLVEGPLADDSYSRLYYLDASGTLRCKLWNAGEIDYAMTIPTPAAPVVDLATTSAVLTEMANITLKEYYYLLRADAGVFTDGSAWRSGGSQSANITNIKFLTDTQIEVTWTVPETLTSPVLDDHTPGSGFISMCKTPLQLGYSGTNYPASMSPVTYDRVIAPGQAFEMSGIGTLRMFSCETERFTEDHFEDPTDSTKFQVRVHQHNVVVVFDLDYDADSFLAEGGLMSYVVTYVTSYGEEGPPSNPTEVNKKVGFGISMNLPAVTPGGYVTKRYIYRTTSGLHGGTFRYVGEAALTSLTFTDSVAAIDLGEELIETENPPSNLEGLVSAPNGMLFAWKGKDIWVSESFKPYSWPADYVLTVDDRIVTMRVGGTDIYALTNGHPYIIVGTDPARLAMSKLVINQSCASEKSACQVGNMIIYASPDGLIGIQGGQGVLLTEQYFRKEEWSTLTPSGMVCESHDEQIHMSCAAGGYIFAMDGDGLVITTNDITTSFFWSDLYDDVLYFIDGTEIKSFGTSDTKYTATWLSKKIETHKRILLDSLRLIADGYTVSCSIMKEATSYWELVTVQDDKPTRIPAIPMQNTWQIKIETSERVDSVALASSMDQL